MDELVTRPEFAIHHPDDETLTVVDALTRLRRDDHQRIAALVEWLAEELARKNAVIYEALWFFDQIPTDTVKAEKALRGAIEWITLDASEAHVWIEPADGISQERVNAARRRIASVQRELERWETVGMQSTCGTFSMQIAMLKDALDLLDEKVKLA